MSLGRDVVVIPLASTGSTPGVQLYFAATKPKHKIENQNPMTDHDEFLE